MTLQEKRFLTRLEGIVLYKLSYIWAPLSENNIKTTKQYWTKSQIYKIIDKLLKCKKNVYYTLDTIGDDGNEDGLHDVWTYIVIGDKGTVKFYTNITKKNEYTRK